VCTDADDDCDLTVDEDVPGTGGDCGTERRTACARTASCSAARAPRSASANPDTGFGDCGRGEQCIDGACVADACGGPCPAGEVCDPNNGRCEADECIGVTCSQGEDCNPHTGDCIPDPCTQIDCPAGFACVIMPDDSGRCAEPYRTPEEDIFAGGGGCAAGGASPGGGVLVGLALLALVRRRGRGLRSAAKK